MHPDYALKSYSYNLPEDRIAQTPASRRDGSKLMVLNKDTGHTTVAGFSDLDSFLPEGALLVANNSKVIPARLFGCKPTGGQVEFLLLTPLPLITPEPDGEGHCAEVVGLLRASKGPRPGETVTFDPNLSLTVLEKGEFGRSKVRLSWTDELGSLIEALGAMPLPPYIHRAAETEDKSRYQTVYARDDKAGSVAAPTAGLHFTPELRKRLDKRGVQWAEVTLYVGYGTFSPVRAADIRDHAMHEEYIEVSEDTAEAVRQAKAEGRPVVAVGTTSARTLEGMYRELGSIQAYKGTTDIFIYPGHRFAVVDRLVTNYHLPESSLIIMVSALAGRKAVLAAYGQALEDGFRFFSYGDAMLIA